MDYFHWHAQFEDPRPILPETCFSPTCLASFETASGVRIPHCPPPECARWVLERREREWRLWRSKIWPIAQARDEPRRIPGVEFE